MGLRVDTMVVHHLGAFCGEEPSWSKYPQLKALSQVGRMRKLTYNDKNYWIGSHRKLGLLIFDPEVQGGVGKDEVRLFKVNQQEIRTFMKNIVGPQLSSDEEEHLPSMQQAVTNYAQVRARLRETHCYDCKQDLNSSDFSICEQCKWIRCPCGACGCGYRDRR